MDVANLKQNGNKITLPKKLNNEQYTQKNETKDE